MNKISIITINYNNCQGLIKTIESVIKQTYTHIEYIIIDGGSNDGSAQVIDSYKKEGKFNHFMHFYSCSEHDGGIYFGMNKGIEQATGDYCLFLNSGDWLCSKNIISNIFQNKNFTEDIIVGRQKHLSHFPFISHGRHIYIDQINKQFFYSDTFPHQCSFISLAMLKKVGGYHTDYRVVSDWIFWYEAISLHNATVKIINKYIAIQEVGGISSNIDRCLQETNHYLMNQAQPFSWEEWISLREAYQYASMYKTLCRSKFSKLIVRIIFWFNK